MLRPVLQFLALLPFLSAAADEVPVWKLVDGDGRPHVNVQVSVVGRVGGALTDAAGSVTLVPDPVPPFELAVFDQRGALLGVLRVPEPPANRTLVLVPAPLEQVTVLSGTAPATSAPPAAAASVFSSVEREESRPAQLVDALAEVPGAGRVGSGPAAVPSLRGLAQGRTLVLIDDARVTAERRAGPSGTFLNPFTMESVEVVRGMGSVAYGSDALGGIIHVRSPQPSTQGTFGRFELAGSRGQERASGALEVNLPVGRGALLVQGYTRDIQDYDSPDGPVVNSGGSSRGLLLRGMAPIGGRRLLFGLQVDRADDVGKPEADASSRRIFYPIEQSTRLTFSAELPPVLGFVALELDGFLGAYRLVTDRDTFATPTTNRMLERADVDAKDASIRFVATRPVGEGMVRLGLDIATRFDLSARNTITELSEGQAPIVLSDDRPIESARRIDSGMFLELERPFRGTPLTLSGGLRGDQVRTRNRGGTFGNLSTTNGDVSGYVALTMHPAKTWSASIQLGRGFRDPRLSDRYFRGVTGRGTIVGNPNLEPEKSDQLDLAFHGGRGPVHVSGYGYLYRVDDLLERFRVSGDLFNFRNRGRAELKGLELEADLTLPRGLDLRLTANYAEGEIVDDATPAADVPPESIGLGLRRREPGRYWWRVQYTQFGRDDAPGDSELVTPGYGVLDVSGGLSLAEGLEARLFVDNVLDRRHPDSSDDRAPLAPGRSIGAAIAGRWGQVTSRSADDSIP